MKCYKYLFALELQKITINLADFRAHAMTLWLYDWFIFQFICKCARWVKSRCTCPPRRKDIGRTRVFANELPLLLCALLKKQCMSRSIRTSVLFFAAYSRHNFVPFNYFFIITVVIKSLKDNASLSNKPG